MESLARIAEQQRRAVLRAFREVVQNIRDAARYSEVIALLQKGDVTGVITLLQLDSTTFEQVEEAIRQAYRTGGAFAADQIGRIPTATGTLILRFDVRSPAAERWLQNMSSRLVAEVSDQQVNMIRDVLTRGLANGKAARDMATDLVGKIDIRTGKKSGGIVGLTDAQVGWVESARQKLETLDPDYLNMKLRDPGFDKTFKQALRDGTPLKKDDIDNAVLRFQARAEKLRGEAIARTESINALRSGQHEAIAQALDAGEVDAQDVTHVWDTSGDSRVRDQHVEMDGQQKAFDEPFEAPDGSLLMHPGDTSLGASAANIIQCRCRERVEINFGGKLKRIRGFA